MAVNLIAQLVKYQDICIQQISIAKPMDPIAMSTLSTIEQALSILNNHDFHYFTADSNYKSAEQKSRESMRRFVRVTNTLPADVRNLLRNLWMATREWQRCFQPMWTAEDHKEKESRKNELQAKVNAILAA